ncbi:hypothetical protein HHK36_002969 [Tetracentron sinense]|uniref:Uncharacterized protein n=1 Tax=Tetracentron sinense TaxID=13715 RepID=A0A834ZRY0_TETSI|nr:hypothetical protein HHK36_002969 [Tetracentron sinense]
MGALCSGGTLKPNSEFPGKGSGFSGKLKSMKSFEKQKKDLVPNADVDVYGKKTSQKYDSGDLPLSFSGELKPSTPARTGSSRVPQMSSLLGRAGIVGLERAVEVLDTLGSSMSNLNASSGFVTGMITRGNKISILAFEVANTIVKGANLLQSLSEENIQFLTKEILHSDGVQQLVSTDMKELLTIAAADKREEFDVFAIEVVRFGDLCKDPQWHNLGRYFQRLDFDLSTHKQLKEEAEIAMQELIILSQHTSELYHELHALDRFEQDYRRKLEEVESLHLPRRGESLMMLRSELKHQRKLVRSLEKKSLWSKNLEEVTEKLVDVVAFIHLEILEAFGNNGLTLVKQDPIHNPQRLGVSGLALHYANIINQIDNIIPRPSSLPSNMRDTLYHGLPTGVKTALRSRLQLFHANEEFTVPQIKAEMEKTLQWLVPIAANTTNNEFNKKTAARNNLIRLQTLYHADKQKTELYILELVAWLHHLITQVRHRDYGFKPLVPVRYPTRKGLVLLSEVKQVPSLEHNTKTNKILQLPQEDQSMLEEVNWRRIIPGISKSQEFVTFKKGRTRVLGLSRSTGSSPSKKFVTAQDLKCTMTNILDVMDGLNTTTLGESC